MAEPLHLPSSSDRQMHTVDVSEARAFSGPRKLQTKLSVARPDRCCANVAYSIVLLECLAVIALGAIGIASQTLPIRSDFMFKAKIFTIYVGQKITQSPLALPAFAVAVSSVGALISAYGLYKVNTHKVEIKR